jgi:RNA polymerase sigma-70 factor (ECF subfamily)
MARYAAGDVDAFRRLFAILAPSVRSFFVRSFRDPEVADDLVQTTFLKLHKARERFKPGLPVKPWLFTIAASVRRDELRRRYRLPHPIEENDWEKLELEMARNDSEEHPDGDVVQTVRSAIDRLPEAQRVVVHLHRYEGMTFEEIAQVLSTKPGAIRSRASRAYEKLREELASLLPSATAKEVP